MAQDWDRIVERRVDDIVSAVFSLSSSTPHLFAAELPTFEADLRRLLMQTSILYQGRTGCQWDFLPHDLPPRSAVYYYFAKWRDDGIDQTIHDLLRWQTRRNGDD